MAEPNKEIEGEGGQEPHRPEVFTAGPSSVPPIQFEMSLGGRPNAAAIIAAKMTPEHIGEAIRTTAEDKKSEREAWLEGVKSLRHGFYAALAALVAIVFIFLYYGHAAELKDIILFLFGAGVGGAGGYGAGRMQRPKTSE